MTGTPVNDLRTFCEYDNTKLIIYIVIMRGNPGATNSNAHLRRRLCGGSRVANVTLSTGKYSQPKKLRSSS